MQFEFRNHYSPHSANCYFLEKIRSMMDKGGAVGAVFLDLKKLFDTVNHKVLTFNLSTFNFSDKALKCSVRIHFRTTLVQSTVYINDLPSVCPEVEIQLYADNIVIYTHDSSKQQAEKRPWMASERG